MKYDFLKLKKAITSFTQEVIPKDDSKLDFEITKLIENAYKFNQQIIHYIGFEVSGQVHIGTGLMTALKIKMLQEAGVKCRIFLANYHTFINKKLDGKMNTIEMVAKDYFAPTMLQCVKIMGGNPEEIEIVLASDIYFNKKKNDLSFWDFDLTVSQNLTLSRVQKSISIMGKNEGQNVEFATLRYPPMQVADAFFMNNHLVHAGMDQRKAHVLMREVATNLPEEFKLKIGEEGIKPIAIHHKLLLGLGVNPKEVQNRMSTDLQPDLNENDVFEDLKMSKSKQNSAIWVHDEPEEIISKIKKAYCPVVNENQSIQEIDEQQKLNPILNWCENLIYPAGLNISLNRKSEFGGDKTYFSYEELKKDYYKGKIHPLDLKNALSSVLIQWLEPIRNYIYSNPKPLKKLKEILKQRN